MPPEVREEVLRRDGYGCQARGIAPERCDGPIEVHHIVGRGMGGSARREIHDPANLMCACRRHHHWITNHPSEAEALGLARRRNT